MMEELVLEPILGVSPCITLYQRCIFQVLGLNIRQMSYVPVATMVGKDMPSKKINISFRG